VQAEDNIAVAVDRVRFRDFMGAGIDEDYRRLEWWVLNWNTPAHDFYRSLGAVPQPDWTTWRIDEAALTQLGGSTS